MFRSLYLNHSISALSHFHKEDLPQPFSNSSFYINIIRNLFVSKTSSEIVQLGLVYDFPTRKSYMSINITTKPYVKIRNIVDVDNFVKWFNNNYAELIFKYENATDTKKVTTFSYNDGYIRYAVIVIESLDNQPEQLIIEFKTLN